jgi:hypothetical protein
METDLMNLFTNDTGAETEIIDADEANHNLRLITGNFYPRNTLGARTDATDDIGSDTYRFRRIYCSDLSEGSLGEILKLSF